MCLTECLMLHFFRNSLDPAARRSACRLLNRKGQQGWIELAEGGKPERRETEQRGRQKMTRGECLSWDSVVLLLVYQMRVSQGAATVQHLCLHVFCYCVPVKSDKKEKIYEAGSSFIWIEWEVLFSSEGTDTCFLFLALICGDCFSKKIKSFSVACCNRPSSVLKSHIRQTDGALLMCLTSFLYLLLSCDFFLVQQSRQPSLPSAFCSWSMGKPADWSLLLFYD